MWAHYSGLRILLDQNTVAFWVLKDFEGLISVIAEHGLPQADTLQFLTDPAQIILYILVEEKLEIFKVQK